MQLNLALALSRNGVDAEAQVQAMHVLHVAQANGWQRQVAEAHLLLGELSTLPLATLTAHLEQANSIADAVDWPALRTHVHQRLGRAYLRDGRTTEAEQMLTRAITDVEQSRATLAEDRFRIAFLTDKADAFDDLVQLHLQDAQHALRAHEMEQHQTALQAAFAVAERAKSRALLDRVANKATQGSSSAPPQHITLNLANVRAQLDAETILLSYYICGDEISAFVISGQDVAEVDNANAIDCVSAISRVSIVQPLLDALSVQWERFIAGPEFVARYEIQLEAISRRILFRLYQELVKPVEAYIARIRARTAQTGIRDSDIPVVVVPHGLLHQVPFHALHDGVDYLVERYQVSYAPSATIFLLSQQRQTPRMSKALVVGTDDAHIPMALIEAQHIAQQLERTQSQSLIVLRLGAQATMEQIQADMADCDIIHLACHSLFRHDNPLFSFLQLHESKLTAADVAQLRLSGAHITLGACESGRSQVIVGDELLGLPRAFLGAGASSVLVSLWLVNDAITAEFMSDWYLQLVQGLPRAKALNAIQRTIKRKHAHPFYWAPFILIGQR